MKRTALHLAILVLALTMGACGHETYLRPISGWANAGDPVFLPLGSGHATANTELPEGIVNVTVIGPSGETVLDGEGDISGFWDIYRFEAGEPGLFVVDVYHSEGAWTHFITHPPTEGYWEHASADEIDFDSLNKTGWAEDWYVERSYLKHCFAKAFVAVGDDVDLSKANEAVGQELEIVPLDDITTVGEGSFSFAVLFRGEPISGLDVWAMKVGDDAPVEGVTDGEGRVSLNLTDTDSQLSEWIVRTDTKMDPRMVEAVDLPRGPLSEEKSYVGPVYRAALTLRSDYRPEGY